jgi:hypothetical protein
MINLCSLRRGRTAALSCIRGGGFLFPSVRRVRSSHRGGLGRLGREEEFRTLPGLATQVLCIFLGSALAFVLAKGFWWSLLSTFEDCE